MLGTYALGSIIEGRGTLIGRSLSVGPEPIAPIARHRSMHFSSWRLAIRDHHGFVMAGTTCCLPYDVWSADPRVTGDRRSPARRISTRSIYGATFAFGALWPALQRALIVPVFSLFADLGIRS